MHTLVHKTEVQMRWFCLAAILIVPAAAFAQQPKSDVFPSVVNGVEYRLTYGQHPRQGWQDGMRFDFSRPETTSL